MTPVNLPFTLSNPDILHNLCYVRGQFVPSQSGKTFSVEDPGSGCVWIECPDSVPEDADAAVQSAYDSFQLYSQTTPRSRAKLLMKWYELIQAAKDDLAKVIVYETGKPLVEAHAEIEYGSSFAWWFSGEADRIQGSTFDAAIPNRRSITVKQPLGVAVALVPWNFPAALVLRKASAALAAGCTMVIKPSPETPISALCLASLARQAGFPAGTLNVLTTSLENTPALSKALCTNPLVKKVSFTGSTRVGKIIAGYCSTGLKKSTLELGGNCPFILFPDADMDLALDQLMSLKWRHAGQACITANRVYVHIDVHDAFVRGIVERTKSLQMGHGMARETTIGPVTVARSLDRMEELVDDALRKGAKIVLGKGRRVDLSGTGKKPAGYFMEPTIVTNVSDDMRMVHEENFGPLLGIQKFASEGDVIRRANETSYGLASYVFTEDVHRLWRMLEKLDAGMIGLNSGNSSAAEAPFGGIKDSGWGKESGKQVALDEYLITKTGTLTIKSEK
ncbi:hypothetical protein N7474_007411 [Penicillium riverlandense]|uniref:uncharacterized protein n=1 Tax=Penicillium riverlandense TaxID=1903569 RepID=UPI002547A7F2|nr:uncharacterized protein N7474_007411 [Penicillium riverlandense]KAJ5815634.1 hypothetical protein N7474_007411 [Penicillium riverlandense]